MGPCPPTLSVSAPDLPQNGAGGHGEALCPPGSTDLCSGQLPLRKGIWFYKRRLCSKPKIFLKTTSLSLSQGPKTGAPTSIKETAFWGEIKCGIHKRNIRMNWQQVRGKHSSQTCILTCPLNTYSETLDLTDSELSAANGNVIWKPPLS